MQEYGDRRSCGGGAWACTAGCGLGFAGFCGAAECVYGVDWAGWGAAGDFGLVAGCGVFVLCAGALAASGFVAAAHGSVCGRGRGGEPDRRLAGASFAEPACGAMAAEYGNFEEHVATGALEIGLAELTLVLVFVEEWLHFLQHLRL